MRNLLTCSRSCCLQLVGAFVFDGSVEDLQLDDGLVLADLRGLLLDGEPGLPRLVGGGQALAVFRPGQLDIRLTGD